MCIRDSVVAVLEVVVAPHPRRILAAESLFEQFIGHRAPSTPPGASPVGRSRCGALPAAAAAWRRLSRLWPAVPAGRDVYKRQLQRRPSVLRAHGHPGLDRSRAGAHTWLRADLDEAVGAVTGATQQAARPVVLERAAEDTHAGRGPVSYTHLDVYKRQDGA